MGIYTFLDLLLLLIHLEVLLFLTIIFCFGNCSLHFFFFCKSQIFQILGLEAPLSCNCMKCHGAVKAAMERNIKDIVDFNSTFPIILWLNFAQ